MGAINIASYLALVAILVQIIPPLLKPKSKLEIHGTAEPRFQKVKDAFTKNFVDGWEREGAAFAVYHKGKLVVDLWGGTADKEAGRPWAQDTMTVVFSSTKAVCALVASMLVDRGLLDYKALVTTYWPAFGQHGKDNVTVEMLLSHQAGLAAIEEPIEKEDVGNWEVMGRHFENQKPNWPPGTDWGYHALTFGFLVDQLLRRVDPKQRSLGTFIKEEIIKETGLEFHLGLPAEEFHKMARHSPPTLKDTLYKMTNFKAMKMQLGMLTKPKDDIMWKTIKNPAWFATDDGSVVTNTPELLALEIGAADGCATARGLAGIFNQLLTGKLINKNSKIFSDIFSNPFSSGKTELIFGFTGSNGYGYGYSQSPKGSWQLGHPGYGGQNVKFDVKNDLAFAYITNGLTPDMGDDAHNYAALQDALYDSL